MASLIATHNRASKERAEDPKWEPHQILLTANFFGLRLIVVNNWLLSVAVLCPAEEELEHIQRLFTRYFFSQLWAEFTIEVLTEFNSADIEYHKVVLQKWLVTEQNKEDEKLLALRGKSQPAPTKSDYSKNKALEKAEMRKAREKLKVAEQIMTKTDTPDKERER